MQLGRVFCAVLLAVSVSRGQKQDQALEGVREYALHYWRSLPGYVCLQVTDREHQPIPIIYKTNPDLRVKELPDEIKRLHYTDVIEEELIVSNGSERYKVLKINDKPSTAKHEQLASTLSSREFGSILERVFDPSSGAKVQWTRADKLHGHRMNVFAFEVPQSAGARYSYPHQRSVLVAYSGLLFADAETSAVMRVEIRTTEFPTESFVRYVTFTLDYKTMKLRDREFALPAGFKLHWERRAPDGASLSAQKARGLDPGLPVQIEEDDTYAEFKNYRAFVADSAVLFGATDPRGEAQSTITFVPLSPGKE